MKLTIKELAENLNCTRSAVSKYLIRSHTIRSKYVTKQGRNVFFNIDGLDELKAKIKEWQSNKGWVAKSINSFFNKKY